MSTSSCFAMSCNREGGGVKTTSVGMQDGELTDRTAVQICNIDEGWKETWVISGNYQSGQKNSTLSLPTILVIWVPEISFSFSIH